MARLEIENLDENLFKYLELSARLTGRTIEDALSDVTDALRDAGFLDVSPLP